MENVIINEDGFALPFFLARLLPPEVCCAVGSFSEIEELHLSVGRCGFVKAGGRNVALDVTLSADEMESLVLSLCGGSLYAHAEELLCGYLAPFCGVRVGAAGQAVMENGRAVGIRDISSLCIRVPHAIEVDVSLALSLLEKGSYTKGLLVYAPPGGGKTSFLRSLTRALASGATPKRVAVIDTRDELAYSLNSPSLCLDLLSGYPKGYGIEIATRTLGAEIIVCDEIGSEEDVRAILSVQSGGVPLVASAHAATLPELMRRKTLSSLHRAGVFGGYIGLRRGEAPCASSAEDADAFL